MKTTTNIPNDILESIISAPLSGVETRIMLLFCRKLHGWHKESDAVSISQVQKYTHVARKTAIENLNKLVTKRLLLVTKRLLPNEINIYSLNENIDEWDVENRTLGSYQTVTRVVTKRLLPLVTKRLPTKETIKESNTTNVVLGESPPTNIQKNIEKPARKENTDITQLIQYFQEAFDLPVLDGTVKQNRFAAHNLIRKFKTLENCQQIIQIAKDDPFWQNKITSLQKLYYNAVAIVQAKRKTNPGFIDLSQEAHET